MNKLTIGTRSAVLTACIALGTGALALVPATQTQAANGCGSVLVKGSDWLAGKGVDVKKNVRGSNGICAGTSFKNPQVQYGNGWDCFELAARLYKVKGWGAVYSKGGGADTIPEGSPWLQYYPNGSGRLPVPGDLVIERYTDHGHVTVVDRVDNGHVYAVEQNATDAGRKTYTLQGSAILGAYNSGIVRGFVHAPANPFGTPGYAPKVALAKVKGLQAARIGNKATISWSKVRSATPVRSIQIQVGKLNAAGTVTSWKSKGSTYATGAKTLRKSIGAAQRELRVRVISELGEGRWVTTSPL